MKSHSSPLGDAIAKLRDSAQEDSAQFCLTAAVHAVIMACLARIFTHLEQIFLLWKSGQLPAPQPRGAIIHPSATPSKAPGPKRRRHAPRHPDSARNRIDAPRADPQPPEPRRIRPRRRGITKPTRAPHRDEPPQHARAPPALRLQGPKTPFRSQPRHGYFITLSN